jgi:5-formyltetrahydrofolate cyclo-ligase
MKKQEARSLFKQKRLELSFQEIESLSEKICATLFTNFQLEEKTISVFLPIERQREINTFKILEKLISVGATVAIPKSEMGNNTLIHYKFESHAQLKISEYGIPEPMNGEVIPPEKFDFVFVPLLAVDKSGHRIGYGKGFYDRFLQQCSSECLFIGLHLFDEFTEIEDIDTHDIQLNYCVTPTKIIHFEK